MRPPRRLAHVIAAACAVGLVSLGGALLPTMAEAIPPTGISGTVTNASSATNPPIEHLNVCVNKKGGGGSCQETFSGGKYTLEVETGEYEVRFTGEICVSGPGRGSSCTYEYVEKVVSPVQVTSGNLTEVNGPLLEVDGKISGTVTTGGAPVGGIEVCASGSGFGCTTTNAGGEYKIGRLPPGSYTVFFSAGEVCKAICQPSGNYILQYWNNQLAFEAAGAVTVKESETTTSINAELQAGGHISGKVVNASIYAQPIANTVVCANPTRTTKEGAREGEAICALTNAAGEYTISALASGGYEVEFRGEACVEVKGSSHCTHPYFGQFYQGIVPVSAPGTISPINGSLVESSPTKPSSTGAPTVTPAQTLIATASPLLNCSRGTWASNPTTLTYRWLRSGVAITGQTANTYTVQGADAGHDIACEVTATNGAGSAAATSNTVQIPKPAPGTAVFKSASVKGSTVSVKLFCTGSSACTGVLKILARVTTRHGRHKKARNTTIGIASFSMALGKSLTLRIHLTGAGRQLLGLAGGKGLKVNFAGSGVQTHTAVLRAASKRHR